MVIVNLPGAYCRTEVSLVSTSVDVASVLESLNPKTNPSVASYSTLSLWGYCQDIIIPVSLRCP